MPLFKYILLALLGSSGVALPGDTITPPSTTLGADAIAQTNAHSKHPGGANAGTELAKNNQHIPRKENGKRRRKPKKHVGGIKYGPTSGASSKAAAKDRVKPDAFTVKQNHSQKMT
jgi:hypothetical protein